MTEEQLAEALRKLPFKTARVAVHPDGRRLIAVVVSPAFEQLVKQVTKRPPISASEIGSTSASLLVALDAGERHRYAAHMSEARSSRPAPPPPARDDAEREQLIAAIEDGLADLDAGRSYSHAEVLAEMRERFTPPPK
jgi:predicted transcriptional regulator